MPIKIEATGATFNTLRSIALGEFDMPNALELAAGKKLGTLMTAIKSTVSDEGITKGIVDWARSGSVPSGEAGTRIRNILALEDATEIKQDAKLINPVNILAAYACVGKDEEKAALRISKLLLLVKQAEFRALDTLVPKLFGGEVRQAISGGWAELGKEKYTGYAGMAKSAQNAINEINKRL